MASAASYLSLEHFETLYGSDKPYYEYWFGQAIQKKMPTALHGTTQTLLGAMLISRGWKAASEVKLKISDFATPIPDLVADLKPLESPYPTKPVTLCVEILSPDDDLRSVFQKCAHYLDWQIPHVWVIDPENRKAYSMSRERPIPTELGRQDVLSAAPGKGISLEELFRSIDLASQSSGQLST